MCDFDPGSSNLEATVARPWAAPRTQAEWCRRRSTVRTHVPSRPRGRWCPAIANASEASPQTDERRAERGCGGRPCGVPCRPKRGRRESGMGDGAPYGRDSVGDGAPSGRAVAPTPRTTRRRGPRRGDPCGRPSRDPIAPGGRAVAHLESSTASFPSYEVASHALKDSRRSIVPRSPCPPRGRCRSRGR